MASHVAVQTPDESVININISSNPLQIWRFSRFKEAAVMADEDDADPELIALLRQSLGLGTSPQPRPADTGVLDSANYIYNNSIDVAIDMYGTKRAAAHIWQNMQQRQYSTQTWSEHELHPKEKNEPTLNFIFTMDLLNFCFWSDTPDRKFTVDYRGKLWTGYWALIAAIQRALDEGIPITSPLCWYMKKRSIITKNSSVDNERPNGAGTAEESTEETPEAANNTASDATTDNPSNESVSDLNAEQASASPSHVHTTEASSDENAKKQEMDEVKRSPDQAPISQSQELPSNAPPETEEVEEEVLISKELLSHVFRSQNGEPIPLIDERLACLHEAGKVLHDHFGGSVAELIRRADGSSAALVNLLAEYFPCFRDESRFERRSVKFYKRAQIFVADVWAAFNEDHFGKFHDIEKLTMFADYRIPQMLHMLGCLSYSPPLESHIRSVKLLEPGHSWEIQLRGCSIWCVEQIRREILRNNPAAQVNAILIDFFLYDTIKELEKDGEEEIPHHRTRSIWY
ncbi:MAG: hypothetical protein M1822_001805 [Bathelium mastoideum]|nr:MAG: hypothetical protein M1822_001805 [Bathelium mastoideum]